LFANGGVDRLEGGSGNDTLDGGWGWDIAIFSGARSEYDVAALVDGQWIVTDSKGWRDGTDQLDNIEALQFSDGLFYF
jgi:serralysin